MEIVASVSLGWRKPDIYQPEGTTVLMNAALVVTLCNHMSANVSKTKTRISFPCRDYFYGKQGADREIDHMTQHVELSSVEAANW